MKKPPDGFCTLLFFASATILIFVGIFLHRLSRLIKVNLKWIRLPKTDSARQKCIIRRYNTNKSKPSWKARNKPRKCHTKTRPFVFCTISKYGMFQILSSRVESSEKVGFDSYGSSVIFDKYVKAQIWSEEDMFNDKIEPIISNGVATIGGKYLIPKGIGTVSWSWTDYEG